MSPSSEKSKFRRAALQRQRDFFCPESIAQHSQQLRAMLIESYPKLSEKPPLNIALYASLPHEVQLLELMELLPQHHYYFPRCQSMGQVTFQRVINPQQELHMGKHHILAPSTSAPSILPQQLDLIIVPGVAFDREGGRLGYGGGYYDRYLALATQATAIALAFPWQIESHIPRDSHDLCIPHLLISPAIA